jgi:hypothetical protein
MPASVVPLVHRSHPSVPVSSTSETVQKGSNEAGYAPCVPSATASFGDSRMGSDCNDCHDP